MQFTLQQINNQFKNKLQKLYSNQEIQQLFFQVCEKLTGYSRVYLIANPSEILNPQKFNIIEKALKRLEKNEPIQYIIGETEFYDLNFKVTPAVLIPRPETEELVHWIINDHPIGNCKIMDAGTGSGCIAISLAKNISNPEVFALDVSKKALEVAKMNATLNNVPINFIQFDILHDSLEKLPQKLDILVSNPPYIKNSEKASMKANVLDYEPELALFVSDNDPLVFYKKIALIGQKILNRSGKLYFEINEALGPELNALLKEIGYSNIKLRKDLYGKYRMIKASL